MGKHFEEKDPLTHVIEKKAEGQLLAAETHGTEMPGHLSAGCDASREMTLALLLVWIVFSLLNSLSIFVLIAFGCGWLAWKVGRSAWLGWARLERLHRLIEQEKYEIEHHRPQEREELVALYGAKGFEGKLLEDVVDVLMADQDRLLKVMLEEEMGLTLEVHEHPLKQCFGAAVGSFAACICSLGAFFLFAGYGIILASIILFMTSAAISAIYEKNRVIAAVIWNLSIGTLACGCTYFILKIIL